MKHEITPDIITTPVPHNSVFTGRMPFLPPNQQCQGTEATVCQ